MLIRQTTKGLFFSGAHGQMGARATLVSIQTPVITLGTLTGIQYSNGRTVLKITTAKLQSIDFEVRIQSGLSLAN